MKPRNSLYPFAGELRNNSTDTERFLWRYLKNRQIEGVKFRRQQPIEAYIVDFVSFDKKIIIELDGGQHADNQENDIHRDACLLANGFVVLRFWNNEVNENIEAVLEVVREQCLCVTPPPPTPSREGMGKMLDQSSVGVTPSARGGAVDEK